MSAVPTPVRQLGGSTAIVSSSPSRRSTGSRQGPIPANPTISPSRSATHHRCGTGSARSRRQRSTRAGVTVLSARDSRSPKPAFHDSTYIRATAPASSPVAGRIATDKPVESSFGSGASKMCGALDSARQLAQHLRAEPHDGYPHNLALPLIVPDDYAFSYFDAHRRRRRCDRDVQDISLTVVVSDQVLLAFENGQRLHRSAKREYAPATRRRPCWCPPGGFVPWPTPLP